MNKINTSTNTSIIGNKIADESIYQKMDHFDEPKQYFKLVLDAISSEMGMPVTLLDVGCSNGAFLYHAGKLFPSTKLAGIEPIESLNSIAKNKLSNADIFNLNILDNQISDKIGKFDVVTMLGVLYIFRDPKLVLSNLLSLMTNNGVLFVFGTYNEEPIDVLLNYRCAPEGEWVEAHNVFSMDTIESYCKDLGVSCRWIDFTMSTPIPKTSDPMRSWTEPFRGNQNHIFYGTNMFATMKLLVIRK